MLLFTPCYCLLPWGRREGRAGSDLTYLRRHRHRTRGRLVGPLIAIDRSGLEFMTKRRNSGGFDGILPDDERREPKLRRLRDPPYGAREVGSADEHDISLYCSDCNRLRLLCVTELVSKVSQVLEVTIMRVLPLMISMAASRAVLKEYSCSSNSEAAETPPPDSFP